MESQRSLTLDLSALASLPEPKRPVFVHEWLRRLDKILSSLTKRNHANDYQKQQQIEMVRKCQKELVSQLIDLISQTKASSPTSGTPTEPPMALLQPGPPTRTMIARCLTNLFSVGDNFLLFDTINRCNDLLKNRDDSPSFLATRLTAIRVVGTMYERLGRLTGRSYEETVQNLTKGLKNAESQTRMETMFAFGKVCVGLGSASANVHRDIYKSARTALTDRAMNVRSAAAICLLSMAKVSSFLYTPASGSGDLDNITQTCFRAFDGANYEARKDIAKLVGTLVAFTQQVSQNIFFSTK